MRVGMKVVARRRDVGLVLMTFCFSLLRSYRFTDGSSPLDRCRLVFDAFREANAPLEINLRQVKNCSL